MNSKRALIAILAMTLFAWGCGADDPAAPGGGGGGGKTAVPWTTAGGDFKITADASAQIADIGTYRWNSHSIAWTTAGGDFDEVADASAQVADVGTYRWSSLRTWTTAGGDFDEVADASAQVADVGTYRWGSRFEMTATVQDWVANPDTDFGWLLMGDETPPAATASAKRFDSRQNATATNRPKLIVYHDGGGTPTTISAVKDNTLYEDAEGDRSNGAGEYLFAGLTAEPADGIRRGLIAFSVANSISATSTIDSVFLELHMSKTTGHPQAFTVTLHRMETDWGEGASAAPRGEGAGGPATTGDATWLHAFFGPSQMTATVQDWVANPDTDFGWLLLGNETTVSAKRFDSRQNATATNRPKLIVYHDGGGTPTTISAVKDNTLYEDAEGDRSNGAGEYLFAGLTAEPADRIRRGLIAFSVANSISATSTVDSVFLELHMSKTTGHPQAFTVTLHRMETDWGEGASTAPMGEGAGGLATTGDATWLHSFFGPSQMTATVEDWVANPDTDFGWLLLGDETPPASTASAKRFDSRQNATAANQPRLIVYHDGSATPTTIPAVKDNTLYEDLEGDRSNGAGEYLFAGKTAEPAENLRRALIAFSVADSIAAAAMIDSVYLELHMSKTTGHPQAFAVTLHRVTANWGEGASVGSKGEGAGGVAMSGDATWLHAFYYP